MPVPNGVERLGRTRSSAGIQDYDLFYFDDTDISWEAEDVTLRRSADVFEGCSGDVEVRNEARVHLWYEQKFGVPCAPYASTEDAIDRFASTTCCLGIRSVDGELAVYAPHGFTDLFDFVLRLNPVQAPRYVYESKAERWSRLWPRLTVLPWPE